MAPPSAAGPLETASVCVVRVWRGPNGQGFRAQITTVDDVESPDPQVTVTGSPEEVLATVARFLEARRPR